MSKRPLDGAGGVDAAAAVDGGGGGEAPQKKRKSRFSSVGPDGQPAPAVAVPVVPVAPRPPAPGMPLPPSVAYPASLGAPVPPPGIDMNVLRAVQEASARAAAMTGGDATGVAAVAKVLLPPSAGPNATPLAPRPVALPGVVPAPGSLAAIQSQIHESLARLKAVAAATAVKAPGAPSAPVAAVAAKAVAAPAAPTAATASEFVNPYLAHRVAKPAEAGAGAATAAAAATETPLLTLADSSTTAATADASVGVDPRLPTTKRRNRDKRAFQFIEEGSKVKEAEKMREHEAMRSIILATRGPGSRRRPTKHLDVPGGGAGAGDGAGGDVDKDANPNTMAVTVAEGALPYGVKVPPKNSGAGERERVVPDLEWWDAAFLPSDKRKARTAAETSASMRGGMSSAIKAIQEAAELVASYAELSLAHCKTAGYVEHPVPIHPAVDSNAPRAMPLMLTKKERKRIRRQKRAEREKERQDKVRSGQLPAPEPKVKLSNLMRVLGDQAVADPSAIEAKVREQMEVRQRNHEMRNLAAKLTPAERKDKMKRKLLKGTDAGITVALFWVADISDAQHRFKLDVNAHDLQLTGCALICKITGTTLVVVEGGAWRVLSRGVAAVAARRRSARVLAAFGRVGRPQGNQALHSPDDGAHRLVDVRREEGEGAALAGRGG
jgi:hypothetical protein